MKISKLKNYLSTGWDQPYIKTVSLTGLSLSILGLIDSIYLTISHYTTIVTLACPETSFINCQKVTTSSYSTIGGIPLVLLGLLFFITMLILQLPISWSSSNKLLIRFRLATSLIGILSVFWLVYVEFHILNSICLYCTGVHILTFGLLVNTLIGTSLMNSRNFKKT